MTRRALAMALAVLLVSSGVAYVAGTPSEDGAVRGPDSAVRDSNAGGLSPNAAAALQETTTTADGGQRTTTAGDGDGQFRLVSATTNVPVDGRGTLALTFVNTGDAVSNASVNAQSPNESVRFGPAQNATEFVGSWARGERRTVRFSLLAEEFAEVRSYPFQASVAYAAANGSRVRTDPFTFGVQPSERIRLDRFEVTRIASTVQAGDTGTISVTVENTGPDVSDAVVSLQARSSSIRLGRTQNATQFVGEWATDEDVTFEFEATASNDTVVASYPFSIQVSYRENGTTNRTRLETFGVVPDGEQEFSLGNVTSTLRVGDEGNVTGTVTNEGPQRASNAVLVLESSGENVFPREEEYALGNLARGESVEFRYRIDVSDNADQGPRQLSFDVEYENQDGDSRRSKPLEARVAVGPRQDEFRVEARNATVTAGGTTAVVLEVTNNENRTLRNVDARAFVDSPLGVEDDQAFVPRLAPNESVTIRFRVSADGSALPATYPLSLDFQYETPDGESKLSDTYQVPVTVTEQEEGGLLPFADVGALPVAIAAVAALIVGVVAIRRWR